MYKKNYVRPTQTTQTVQPAQLIATSVKLGSSSETVDTKTSGAQLENERSGGTWGDIWEEGKE